MKYKRRNSITIKVWTYFLVFAIILLTTTYVLQIVFIDQFYESMKSKQVEEKATAITAEYKNRGYARLMVSLDEYSEDNDIYIRVDEGFDILYPTLESDRRYVDEIASLGTTEIGNSEAILENKKNGKSIMVYSRFLDKDSSLILYIVAPLYPLGSTIEILQNQMMFVILIALLMAFFFATYMSSRFSRPIKAIGIVARKLAGGQYGVTFNGDSKYTEIQELTETFNKMSCELEKSVMLQKDLMANVSHDLRTPLTMIKSYAEMLRDLSGDNPEKRTEHLNVIMDEADRLNFLVKDIMAITALQSGSMQIDMKPFDIRECAERVLQTYKILEEQDDFKLEFNCKQERLFVLGDVERIEQVLSNFITNGIKYCGTDRKIIINLKRWGKTMHCEVIDHGMGIKPEEMEHIWERYYKTSSNHVRTTTGTGLGLSIVKEILSLHRSQFGVESKVGRGTTFWFELDTATPPKKDDV